MAVKTTLRVLALACTTRRCVAGSTVPMDLNLTSACHRASVFRANSMGYGSWTVVPAKTGKGIPAALMEAASTLAQMAARLYQEKPHRILTHPARLLELGLE
jgi:hypothetical protein